MNHKRELVALITAAMGVSLLAGQPFTGEAHHGAHPVLASATSGALDGVPLIAQNVEHIANVPGMTGGHTVVEGDRLYQGAYGMGFRAFSLADPAAPVEIGRWLPGPKSAADPGARADAVPDVWAVDDDGTQRHIVAFGGTSRHSSTIRTEFVDMTDPANPNLLWMFTGSADGEAHNSDVIDERALWIPSGTSTNGGLRIYDLTPLLSDPPAAPEPRFLGNPGTLWRDSPYRPANNTDFGFTHTHDVEAYVDLPVLQQPSQWVDQDGDGTPDPTYAPRDLLFMAEGGNYTSGNNTGSVFIVDITNPSDPVVLNRWRNNTGHAIRYNHEVQLLDSDPSVMIVSDEDMHSACEAGGIVTVRLSPDYRSSTKMAEWFNGTGTPAAVCSVHVMSTQGPYLYIGSYSAGLQVVDLRDPAKPVRAGQNIIGGVNTWGALVHGDYVYTGDMGARGLDVFKFTPAS